MTQRDEFLLLRVFAVGAVQATVQPAHNVNEIYNRGPGHTTEEQNCHIYRGGELGNAMPSNMEPGGQRDQAQAAEQ
jgi:hypothetical protein